MITVQSRRLDPDRVALLAGLAAVLAGLVVDLVAWLSVHDQDLAPAAESAEVTLGQARAVINSLFAILVGLSVLGGGLWLLLLWSVYRHRRCSARITATVLAVIWMLLEISSVTGHVYGGRLTAIPAIVNELAVVVTLACLHTPSGRALQRRFRRPSPPGACTR